MNRRTVLRGLATAGTATLAGCGLLSDDEPGAVPVSLDAVDVLNRRADPETFALVARRDGEVVERSTREIAGTDDDSRPTGVEFEAWPAARHRYGFELSVEGGDSLSTTPRALGVRRADADCVRVVFVLNVDSRLTAHARTPCGTGELRRPARARPGRVTTVRI